MALDEPCVPIGEQKKLLDFSFSVLAVVAGDTLLYSTGGTISQLDIPSGERKVVLRSDGISEFGVLGDALVYYEANGNPSERTPIDVIIDHGARSTSRYQRISPRPGDYNAGLITTPNGIYWWTSPDGTLESRTTWRWNPETEAVEPFEMQARSIVRADDSSFFYFDTDNRLVVRSQTTGLPMFIEELDPAVVTPYPIAIDGDEVYYLLYSSDELDGDLVARKIDGSDERLLVGDRKPIYGAIDPTYVYFTESLEGGRGDIYRVPRAGGDIQTFFDGEEYTDVFDIRTDACNVYWQHYAFQSGALYGREITP